jgi:hypothetical protein
MSSKIDVRSINEIRRIGIDALADALEPVDMEKFLQSFDLGSGAIPRSGQSGWIRALKR